MSEGVRPAAVAGSFYPLRPDRLEAEIREHLAAADPVSLSFTLRILIVPHAGYVYSGPVAATGYQLLAGLVNLRRIVLIGPAHYVGFAGLALPGVARLQTPLGEVAVDTAGAELLAANPLVVDAPQAHEREHSLEVQLPFLQMVCPGVRVVPLLTGQVDAAEVATAISPLLDEDTLLLVSSDLSHYYDATTARQLDAATAAAIERRDPNALGRESACGRTGVQAALHLAQRYEYSVKTLDLRNSADTAGSPERVVGYGSFAMGR
jgi:AmmeMemoRadiSam system protein B